MAYTVEVLVDRAVLVLRLFGPVAVEDRAAGLREILASLDETGFKRVIVDYRDGLTFPGSVDDTTRHAANLARAYRAMIGVRIAYVSKPQNRDATPIEVLAASRGYFYQRFTDIAKAFEWLEA